MDFKSINWRGFNGLEFTFENKKAILIKPEKPNGKFMIKTENHKNGKQKAEEKFKL